MRYPTLGEARLGQVDDTYYYSASCQNCLRKRRISLIHLRAQLGADFPLDKVRERLKCSSCGSRKIILAYFTPAHRASGGLAPVFDEPFS